MRPQPPPSPLASRLPIPGQSPALLGPCCADLPRLSLVDVAVSSFLQSCAVWPVLLGTRALIPWDVWTSLWPWMVGEVLSPQPGSCCSCAKLRGLCGQWAAVQQSCGGLDTPPWGSVIQRFCWIKRLTLTVIDNMG